MAGSKSDYLEGKVLDHILGAVVFTTPATVYVALYTAAPTDSTAGTEVTGGAYARVAVVNNATNWPAATGSQKKNANDVVYPTATASWGSVVAFAILDASSAGNILYWGDLVTPKTITTGDTAKFAANDITITED